MVQFWRVCNVPGPRGVLQRRERLLAVVAGRGDGRDDGRFGLAAQGVLQETGQLGLSERREGRIKLSLNDVLTTKKQVNLIGKKIRRQAQS